MKHTYISKAVVLSLIMALPCASATSQCTTFVKKKCMPKIQPFTHNGQVNTSTLSAGQNSEYNFTFYAGQAYRILVGAEPVLGEVSFRVLDQSRKVVFDSKENDSPDFWDFKMKNTQQLIVQVTIPASASSSSTPPSGCVSVLVGFKKD
ncbi:MAG: hypothetical protein JWO09_1703 [Bacteroidetes bacterium]|nr:hypothetical protein [Bacteroidota bacterium]